MKGAAFCREGDDPATNTKNPYTLTYSDSLDAHLGKPGYGQSVRCYTKVVRQGSAPPAMKAMPLEEVCYKQAYKLEGIGTGMFVRGLHFNDSGTHHSFVFRVANAFLMVEGRGTHSIVVVRSPEPLSFSLRMLRVTAHAQVPSQRVQETVAAIPEYGQLWNAKEVRAWWRVGWGGRGDSESEGTKCGRGGVAPAVWPRVPGVIELCPFPRPAELRKYARFCQRSN